MAKESEELLTKRTGDTLKLILKICATKCFWSIWPPLCGILTCSQSMRWTSALLISPQPSVSHRPFCKGNSIPYSLWRAIVAPCIDLEIKMHSISNELWQSRTFNLQGTACSIICNHLSSSLGESMWKEANSASIWFESESIWEEFQNCD